MITIDQYAYSSQLRKVCPKQKVGLMGMVMLTCLLFSSKFLYVSVILLMGGITLCKGKIPCRVYGKVMAVPLSFLILGVLTILFQWGHSGQMFLLKFPIAHSYIGITKASLALSAVLFLKVLACSSCLFFLCLSTPISDVLGVLEGLKCPGVLTELMGLIYRLIFVVVAMGYQIQVAQMSRLGYQDFRRGIQSFGLLLSSLFVRTLKMNDSLYRALESRGYNGTLKVLSEGQFERFKVMRFIWLEVGLLMSVAIEKWLF